MTDPIDGSVGSGGFIVDDDDEVAFFMPGDFDVTITPVDGSEPHTVRAHISEWQGMIDGKPIVTIPLEEGI